MIKNHSVAYATKPGATIADLQANLKPVAKSTAKLTAEQALAAAMARIEALEAQNAALAASKQRAEKSISWEVSVEVIDPKTKMPRKGKGGIKVMGLNITFPVTLFLSQWIRFLELVSEFTAYLYEVYDNPEVCWRDGEKEKYRERMQALYDKHCKAA